jgi:uncharacterized protein YjiS (DUF1127 family)
MRRKHIRTEAAPLPAARRSIYMQCTTKLSLWAPPRSGIHARKIAMFVTMIAAKIRAYLRYRETVRELSRLTDRELDDLGLSRTEIAFIARATAAA